MQTAGAGGPPGLVFTDLDGTLLDHDSYDWSPARAALGRLRERGVPVVLCSSKTRAEMVPLQGELGLSGPLISENGGGVFLTGGGRLEGCFPERIAGLPAQVLGTPYRLLRGALAELSRHVEGDLRGFGDVSVEVVARWTGLGLARAQLARQRDYDEPFRWEPEPAPADVERARAWLAGRGLQLTRGGRFWHLLGDNDKGRAVTWLLAAVARSWGRRPRSLALGDSENDLAMLRAADQGVLVERPGGGHLEPRPPGLVTQAGVGPRGWAAAVSAWLDALQDVTEAVEPEGTHG